MGIEILLSKISDYSPRDKELIIRAFEFASTVHYGIFRKSGEPYIIHPLWVACILADMHADADTISAGLLHDCVEDGIGITVDTIEKSFNKVISMLVDGVTKMHKIEFNNDKKMTDVANTRKIIESITFDIRIFIIKLADRLHNMRTLEFQPQKKQIEHSVETMEIYSPFASLIGEYTIKCELDDLCFKYLSPTEYNNMQKMVKKYVSDRRLDIDEVICTVGQMLNSNNIPFDIKVKVKNYYSLYTKLKTYGSLEKIHDTIAIKLLVDDIESCYQVRDLLVGNFSELMVKRKDYINNPKTNMYRSLHSSITSPKGNTLQFQIKTPNMYMINAYGITAYWNLLKNQKNVDPAEEMQNDIRKFQFFQILDELVKENVGNERFIQEVRDNLLTKKIYVKTPKGETYELPYHSTPVDLAFKIHTEIGNSVISAVVDNERVPLNYELQNGQMVELYTNDLLYGPRLPYHNYCITSRAKKKIREFNRKLYRKDN